MLLEFVYRAYRESTRFYEFYYNRGSFLLRSTGSVRIAVSTVCLYAHCPSGNQIANHTTFYSIETINARALYCLVHFFARQELK